MLLTDSASVTVKDLRSEWTVYRQGGYRPLDQNFVESEQAIYFPLHTGNHRGQFLQITATEPGHVFINGRLIESFVSQALYNIDSLGQRYGSSFWVGIYSEEGLVDLTTRVVTHQQPGIADPPVLLPRPPTFFRDYGILVSAFLLFFLVVLFRSNPQLTLDYFSFSKIFSQAERNETQLASRITSSENLLFYLFCALLTGFLLSTIFYSSGPFFHAARPLIFTSLGSSFLIWGRLTVFILLLLIAKLTIVLLFSTLFNFRETISFQFFNFLRFVLFTAVVLSGISLVLFVFGVSAPAWYERLVVIGLIMLTIGSAMVLMKLLRKSHLSFFHLFSYLCISEFIPLVILFKIFF